MCKIISITTWPTFFSTLEIYAILYAMLASPAVPSDLVHVKNSNTLTTATITWESVISYTVYSTSAGAQFSGITQTSYTLRDLEVETDYVVSVTATNECGIESPPSEEITVRIDAPGTVYMYVVQFSMCYQTFGYIF